MLKTGKKKRKIEVTAAQKKTMCLIWLVLKNFEILENPAFSYSFPSMINKSQKWGSCHRNIKMAMYIIVGCVILPPANDQPIKGGTAPTKAPGKMERADFIFRGV